MQETISVECPHCGEPIVVVVPESESQDQSSEYESEHAISAELVSWEEVEVTDPYSGNDHDIPVSQRLKADIQIDGEVRPFTFWYTPEYGYFKYVVRGQLESGLKSKDADSQDGELFFLNRGVPRDSDKQWTYLSADECRRRSKLAGLGDVAEDPDHEDKDNRFRIFLDEQEQPLVDDGDVAEELILKLAKGLVTFQTAR